LPGRNLPASQARSTAPETVPIQVLMKRIKAIFFFVAVLAVGVFMTISGVKEYKNSKLLQKEGKQALGKVVDGEERRGRRGRRSYYLTVTFQTAANQSVQKELKVSREVYSKATSTGNITVHYLASNPQVCAFGDKAEAKFGTVAGGVLAVVVSIFLFKGSFGSGDSGEEAVASSSTPGTQIAQNNQTSAQSDVSSDSDDLEEAA
jgi:hypothetical protein